MSLIKYKIKYDDIIEMAEVIHDNPVLNRPGLVLEYSLDEFNHRKLNEELFFRTNGEDSEEELEYFDVIELSVSDIYFRFVVEYDYTI